MPDKSLKRESLSIVVLTKNESQNISALMENIKWSDEIVVVDDNSTDETVSLAKEYTDKVISRTLNKDFAAQRNFGSDNASGDWILQMDADERITEYLKNEIINILNSGVEKNAFTFGRKNNFCGKFLKYAGEDSHRPLRLFRKGKGVFYKTKIHESVKVEGETGHLKGIMEHYNFPAITHYVETQDFYTGIEAGQLFDDKGILKKKELKQKLLFSPLKLFIKLYIKKKGYKDGFYGLIFCFLSAWRRFMIYAKYWEIHKKQYGD